MEARGFSLRGKAAGGIIKLRPHLYMLLRTGMLGAKPSLTISLYLVLL
jgi:hypothetical protein